jgi:putative nucleotidyltransferase with HDIG domain
MGVPLVARDTVIGFMTLDSNQPNAFSHDQITLIKSFAAQSAQAMDNARLFGNAQRRLERLASLHDIDQAISSSLDLYGTLNILLGHILRQLQVDAAAVLLYQPELQSLEFAAGQGFRTHSLKFTNLRLGEGFAGRAALERHIVQIWDLTQANTGFLRSPEFRAEQFVSYIGVPLIAKGNIIGVLEIYHRQSLDPDSEWMDFLDTLAGQAAIAIDNVNLFSNLQRSNLELVQAYDATIEGWAKALELRDMETEGHSRRVVDLTLKLAAKMGIRGRELVHVRRGALLHDIGKMSVPDSILQKRGKLTDAEWKIMQQHPVHAHKMLASIPYLHPVLDIPYCHHEKWDGSGYPRGLTADQIPLAARVFSVVDVWDALLSDRPYREAWPQEKVLLYLQDQAGKQFDPQVVDAFMELLLESKRIET